MRASTAQKTRGDDKRETKPSSFVQHVTVNETRAFGIPSDKGDWGQHFVYTHPLYKQPVYKQETLVC